MNNKKILIRNGQMVSSKGIFKKNILIQNGKIANIGELSGIEADYVIDASKKYILPGIIDPQVHFRDPGFPDKEDLRTGSMAAAAGGVTTFFEMPNTNPATTTIEKLNQKYDIASQKVLLITAFSLELRLKI